jgi:Rps23 Pro-64 3,4-dihydroxylase Tpa1-like proline 4-hydroxylase
MYSLNKNFTNSFFPLGFFEVKNFLTDEEIQSIHKHAESLLFMNGAIMADKEQTPSFLRYDGEKKGARDSKICWLYPKNNETIKSIYRKIFGKIIEINDDIYKFNLTDVETFQYTVYSDGQFYDKHLDLDHQLNAGNVQRKLSFSIQLTNPTEYEGGELLAYNGKDSVSASKEKGTIIFFPSFTLHEVTPVTKGTRKSLVGWVHGPKFT